MRDPSACRIVRAMHAAPRLPPAEPSSLPLVLPSPPLTEWQVHEQVIVACCDTGDTEAAAPLVTALEARFPESVRVGEAAPPSSSRTGSLPRRHQNLHPPSHFTPPSARPSLPPAHASLHTPYSSPIFHSNSVRSSPGQLRGMLLESEGKWDAALQHYDALIEKMPNSEPTYKRKARERDGGGGEER